jgi:hypothetical protein
MRHKVGRDADTCVLWLAHTDQHTALIERHTQGFCTWGVAPRVHTTDIPRVVEAIWYAPEAGTATGIGRQRSQLQARQAVVAWIGAQER